VIPGIDDAPSSSSRFSETYFAGIKDGSSDNGAPGRGASDDLGRVGDVGRKDVVADIRVDESEDFMVGSK
jgi:hypothetical protein